MRKIIIISTRAITNLFSGLKQLKSLNKYLWKYKWHFGLGLLFIIVSDLYGVWAQIFIREGVDTIANHNSAGNVMRNGIQPDSVFYEAILYFLIMFTFYNLIKGFFLFLQRQSIIVMSRRIEFDQKNDIYNHYQKLPASFYQKGNTGDIMNRISEDVGKVRMYVGPGIMYTINLLVLVTIVITQMIQVNAELTLYVLTPLPIMCFIVFYLSKKINERSSDLQRHQSDLTTQAQEDFSGIRLIKTFGRQKESQAKFEERTMNYYKGGISLLRVDAGFIPVMTVLVGLSTLLTICIGGIQCINGKISIGNIAEFVLYVNMLTWPFASVGWISSLVQRAAASQERINEFLNEKPAQDDSKNWNKIPENYEEVRFENVNFTYPGSRNAALKDINFTIKKGHSVGIIGRTGSGKSTIGNLLNAVRNEYSGNIFIGDVELRTIELNSLRDKLSCVPQEAYLFSDTIANNILFGATKKNLQPNAVEYYSKKAAVHDNIISFEKGYDTVVGERGITLSGGQKQRITIARALIREPEILIVDDCLSAVDTETEKEILENLIEQMRGKTTVLISHRVATVMHADEILVIDEGRIVERGKHSDLIQSNGLYSKIYNRQSSAS